MTNSNNYNLFIDSIKKIVDSKLSKSQIERGYLTATELAYVLKCSERILFTWRKQRKEGNKNVGVSFFKFKGQYFYPIESIYQYYLSSAIF